MLEKGRGIREQWGSRMKKEKEDEEDSLVPVYRGGGGVEGMYWKLLPFSRSKFVRLRKTN